MAESTKTLQYLIRACRSCLDTNFTMSVSLQDHDWLELYKYCADAEIPDEQLPHLLLCSKCAVTVKCFAEFKRKCAESEAFWHSLLKKKVVCKTTAIDWPLIAGETVPLKIKSNASELDLEVNAQTEIKSEFEDSDHGNEDDTMFDEKHETISEYFTADVKDEDKSTLTNIETLNDVSNIMAQHDPPIPENEQETKLNVKSKCINKAKTRQSASKIRVKEERESTSVLKRKRKIYQYTCDMCGANFLLKTNLILHIKQHNYLECCGLCEYKAADAAAVNKHVVEHYTNNELRCRLCEYEGKDFACMVSHRLKHMDRLSKNIVCILCVDVKRSAASVEFHFRQSHLGRPGGLCRTCHKPFKCQRKWLKHEFFHTGGFWCKMKHCDYRCQKKEAYEKHLQNHPSTKTYICDTCGYICHKNSNLQSHITHMHTPHVTVTCDVCGIKCKSFSLAKHMKIHQERQFKCPSCPKTYHCKSMLRAHELQHTAPDAKPHKCDICGLRYRWKSGLTSHLAVHTGKPVATCAVCGEKFISHATWRRHRVKHTGVQPYPCTLCDKAFTAKGRLKQHVAKHHDYATTLFV